MPVCPQCTKMYRSRVQGKCPGCGVRVELVDKEWIVIEPQAPSIRILEHFESLISRRESAKLNRPVPWQVPRRGASYRMELAVAKRMAAQAGDSKLACRALDILFERFIGRNCTSLLLLQRDYPLALTLARARQEKEEEKEQLEQETLEALRGRLDLFSE